MIERPNLKLIEHYITQEHNISLLDMVNQFDTLLDFIRASVQFFNVENKDISIMDDTTLKQYIRLCIVHWRD